MNNKLLAISGSVACGKSTLIQHLKEYLDKKEVKYYIVHEVVENEIVRSILNKTLKDKNFAKQNLEYFQNYLLGGKQILLSELLLTKLANEYDLIILDRDWLEDKIFYDLAFENEGPKNNLYMYFYNAFLEDKLYHPYIRIYLTKPFNQQLDDYIKRENLTNMVDIDNASKYLQRVNKEYQIFYQNHSQDENFNEFDMGNDFEINLKKILKFIEAKVF